MKIILIAILAVAISACTSAKRGPTFDGETLGTCPTSPNCISSLEEDEKHYLGEIEYDVSREEAKEVLLEILKEEKSSEIIKVTDNYIHVIFKSGVFKFIDDLEFVFREDEDKIDFRSAARSGYSDFGVNRKRLEKIKYEFENKTK